MASCIAAVRAGGNEATGQDFIEILLSDQIQLSDDSLRLMGGYPVKREYVPALLEAGEQERNMEFVVENDYKATLTNLRAVVPDETLMTAAKSAALACYQGALTVEEAVARLREETELYLAEQRG